MRVSIITTSLNRELVIRDAIKSVLEQTYWDIEYIVIDGDSKDGTFSIIKEYENQINTIISEHDSSMYEAINKGIRLATGDIIGLLHSDDILFSPITISQIVDKFEQSNADLVYGNGIYVDNKDVHKIVRNWISGPYDKRKIRKGWLPLHPSVYIKRSCIEELGLYNEHYRIAADTDYLIRYLFKSTLKVEYLDEYIVQLRMGGLSTHPKNQFTKWSEDIHLYREHGFNPYIMLAQKIISKVPQFISAMFLTKQKRVGSPQKGYIKSVMKIHQIEML